MEFFRSKLKQCLSQMITVPRGQAIGRGLESYGYTATRTIDGSLNLFKDGSYALVYSGRVITLMCGSTG